MYVHKSLSALLPSEQRGSSKGAVVPTCNRAKYGRHWPSRLSFKQWHGHLIYKKFFSLQQYGVLDSDPCYSFVWALPIGHRPLHWRKVDRHTYEIYSQFQISGPKVLVFPLTRVGTCHPETRIFRMCGPRSIYSHRAVRSPSTTILGGRFTRIKVFILGSRFLLQVGSPRSDRMESISCTQWQVSLWGNQGFVPGSGPN